ncbi:STE/STE7/MEK1 protein kinase [Coprinopsis cinerea okayama7|uniref:STE/STE7/MEK1 protein kinase n=1 Tax=Coprinopsis cinerea (strain Okayama-7 / 130 / ATCC MYA-4618 / FGSC 9003) TaxID=240176 RepID=A8NQZ7_COPC7|nr:STE/STE7/MEK1 protein kinase [Coprinopsis cinerea okayama7\|eukprot:XP_001835586.2 STE/STE7/MEK1 protein kinase [Coprinopsis cinerea okayama7\
MATPIRKKRNFKALQLNVGDPQPASPSSTEPDPISIRTAPTAVGPRLKKKPPPMTLAAPKINSVGNVVASVDPPEDSGSGNFLVVSNGPNSAPLTGTNINVRRNTLHATLSTTLANLDMNKETKLELRNEDLVDIHDLGQGNGGSVKKVEHTPTKMIMAKKTVLIDAKPSVRKQILRELHIMHDCRSDYIISFYGAFLADNNICICMEFMDKGSLDGIYKKIGAIDIDIVGKIALAVLEGLTYLYDVHRIIHRDIKPSNILCNSRGQIKICDFGVSGELINSIADTFVGTSTYMSPERIQGAQYTVKSDVWSLGISLIELALGRFPFSQSDSDESDDEFSDASDYEGTLSPQPAGSVSLADLPPPKPRRQKNANGNGSTTKKDKRKSKGHIVNEPAPRLTPEGRYPKAAESFIDACLLKDPDARQTPKDLLKHEWIENARMSSVDVEAWANTF